MDGRSGSVVISRRTFPLHDTTVPSLKPPHRMGGAEHGQALPIRTLCIFLQAHTKFFRRIS